MRYLVLSFSLAAALLAGCQHPAPVVEDPIVVEHEKSLNRAQVRDDSALLQEETIGGAAFRKEENSTQVLFNKHHEGEIDKMSVLIHDADKKALSNSKQSGTSKASGNKAKSKNSKNQQKAKGGSKSQKDRSIYAKDKSIYSNDK